MLRPLDIMPIGYMMNGAHANHDSSQPGCGHIAFGNAPTETDCKRKRGGKYFLQPAMRSRCLTGMTKLSFNDRIGEYV